MVKDGLALDALEAEIRGVGQPVLGVAVDRRIRRAVLEDLFFEAVPLT